MAIAYKSQGAGVSSETTAISLQPACPATVDAGDILIAHIYWEGTADAPSTPSGWTLLHGPEVIQTTVARHWVFGRIADGSEDGATVTFALAPVSSNQRAARIYSFSGRVSGSITNLVRGFAATSHATDPQMPTVTTTIAGGLAVALIGQNDNNAQDSPTGETGGDWVKAVTEYTAALTPGLALSINTCTPTADPGTVSGGSDNTLNDPVGVIGFEIRPSVPATVFTADSGAFTLSGTAAALNVTMPADSGSVAISGTAATLSKGILFAADPGSVSVAGTPVTLTVTMPADAGAFALAGSAATFSVTMPAQSAGFAISGTDAALTPARSLAAAAGSADVAGTAATFAIQMPATSGSFVIAGTDANLTVSGGNVTLVADPGAFTVAGTPASLLHAARMPADAGAIVLSGTAASFVIGGNKTLSAQAGQIVVTGTAALLRYSAEQQPQARGGGIIRRRRPKYVPNLLGDQPQLNVRLRGVTRGAHAQVSISLLIQRALKLRGAAQVRAISALRLAVQDDEIAHLLVDLLD